jgi:hypothetical protein
METLSDSIASQAIQVTEQRIPMDSLSESIASQTMALNGESLCYTFLKEMINRCAVLDEENHAIVIGENTNILYLFYLSGSNPMELIRIMEEKASIQKMCVQDLVILKYKLVQLSRDYTKFIEQMRPSIENTIKQSVALAIKKTNPYKSDSEQFNQKAPQTFQQVEKENPFQIEVNRLSYLIELFKTKFNNSKFLRPMITIVFPTASQHIHILDLLFKKIDEKIFSSVIKCCKTILDLILTDAMSVLMELISLETLHDLIETSLESIQLKSSPNTDLSYPIELKKNIKNNMIGIQRLIYPDFECNDSQKIKWLFSSKKEDQQRSIDNDIQIDELANACLIEIRTINTILNSQGQKMTEVINKLELPESVKKFMRGLIFEKKKKEKKKTGKRQQVKMTENSQQSLNFGNVKNQNMTSIDSPKVDQSSQPNGGRSPVHANVGQLTTTKTAIQSPATQSTQFEENKTRPFVDEIQTKERMGNFAKKEGTTINTSKMNGSTNRALKNEQRQKEMKFYKSLARKITTNENGGSIERNYLSCSANGGHTLTITTKKDAENKETREKIWSHINSDVTSSKTHQSMERRIERQKNQRIEKRNAIKSIETELKLSEKKILEYQRKIKTIQSGYGYFKAGNIKSVEQQLQKEQEILAKLTKKLEDAKQKERELILKQEQEEKERTQLIIPEDDEEETQQ